MRWLQGIASALLLCICFTLLSSTLVFAHASNRVIAASSPTTQRRPYIPAEAQGHAKVTQKGSLFIVTYFKTGTGKAATSSSTSQRAIPHANGCFPDDAIWTWFSIFEDRQAWIGPQEEDPDYGVHNNLHIQTLCGPDQYNYHIRYIETDDDNFTWEVYDSVHEKTTLYEAWAGEGVIEAADNAGSQFAGNISKEFSDLGQNLFEILPDVFESLVP